MAGFAAPRWYPDAPENHLPLRLQRHVSDQLRCSKQPRLLRRALPILPPTALTATAHLQPLAQPTALRHPGFRCDIDSHPDCRPFLILIVAPHPTGRDTTTHCILMRPRTRHTHRTVGGCGHSLPPGRRSSARHPSEDEGHDQACRAHPGHHADLSRRIRYRHPDARPWRAALRASAEPLAVSTPTAGLFGT